MKSLSLVTLCALALAAPAPSWAWGASGHRMVGAAAVRALPGEVPAFLRTARAVQDVGELSREPDRSKGAGKLHDSDRDPGHFIDLDENGAVLGGPPMLPLAATRADYEAGLRAAGLDQWQAGYLPYAIVDRWQQLTSDFAYWRVLRAAEANPAWKARRDWFRQDRLRREALILKDLGELSHFVADGSQPLHVTRHYNGWGDGPNPNGYSTAKLHASFEGALVQTTIRPAALAARIAAPRSCGCPIEVRVGSYLARTARQVIPFYEMEKAGGMRPGDPRGPEMALAQLAAGASELRDLTLEAWRASEARSVGWKPVAVRDVVDGRVDPFPSLYGVD